MDQLTGMAVFARVADARSFSEAARQLGLSKSAVSKQVSKLEDRLGVRLLNRTTRRLGLTEVGSIYYDYCSRMLGEAEEAERAVTALQAEPRGLLKVNAPMSFGQLHLAPALSDFMSRFPDVRIDLSLNDRVVDIIEEGFDVAVRIATLPDSSLVARRLAPSRFVLCATPAYFAAHGEPKTPEDLKQHKCLLYAYSPVPDEWTFEGKGGRQTVRVSGALQANNGDVLRTAALAGAGLTLSPTFIVGPDLKAGRLKAVMCDYCRSETAIYAVYPHRRHLSAKVRAFVDFLGERFGPEPYWDAAVS